MKAIFIHSKYTGKVDLSKIELDKLPDKLGLVTTTQFLGKTTENRIRTEKGVEVSTSPPIVVYRETITKPSQEIAGKTPAKRLSEKVVLP